MCIKNFFLLGKNKDKEEKIVINNPINVGIYEVIEELLDIKLIIKPHKIRNIP